jgi:sensor domain CHASE-containing protein
MKCIVVHSSHLSFVITIVVVIVVVVVVVETARIKEEEILFFQILKILI